MATPPPAASPQRWIPLVTVILAIVGAAGVVFGGIEAFGGWRATIDDHLATLDRRMEQAESNQKTYIPVLLGLSKDVSFLAERAHREDDAREREHR